MFLILVILSNSIQFHHKFAFTFQKKKFQVYLTVQIGQKDYIRKDESQRTKMKRMKVLGLI